jgi:hypothetical protein
MFLAASRCQYLIGSMIYNVRKTGFEQANGESDLCFDRRNESCRQEAILKDLRDEYSVSVDGLCNE